MASLSLEQFASEISVAPRGATRVQISRAAVLGAGTMGARIAAHFANAGHPVLLLDLASPAPNRNAVAARAMEALKTSRPAALADPSFASLIKIGNFEDDLQALNSCDWIIEAVAENLEIKRALLSRVAPHVHPNALLTTNTSGIPVAKIAEALPIELRSRWFGTHFFNPPRYMRLLEIIATPGTDEDAVAAAVHFAELKLGKTTVRANDAPNFIANRIGVFAMLNAFRIMRQRGLTIEEIDALTGSVIGWPKTGTFHLADMVGIDVLVSVAKNFETLAGDERSDLKLPSIVETLLERKWLGDKTRQGFYKKERGADGKELRLVLDLETLAYRPTGRPALPELETAKANEGLAARLRSLLSGDPASSKAAGFYWQFLPELWFYAANRVGEAADSIVAIDRAMKSGFNWEFGPFEMWDIAGTPQVAARVRELGISVPPALSALLAAGGTTWYRSDGEEYFDPPSGIYVPVERSVNAISIGILKKSRGVFAENPSISLVDLGDGIGCFEFHSKMNSIGQDIVEFLDRNLAPSSDAVRSFEGFVVANGAENFSAGANLMQLLLTIQDEEWDEIDRFVRAFQRMTQAIKFCPRPVVSAPCGLCLGGGTEIIMHSAARQPHLELYAGLVETSVGLLPAGGGCKEMLLRAIDSAASVRADGRAESVEVHDALRQAFETVAMAKVSASAPEARTMKILKAPDVITMNRERLIADAKALARRLVREGYTAPVAWTSIPAPGQTVFANLKLGALLMREGEYISDHDVTIATHVARVLSGGNTTAGTPLSEQYLLDLEREAFLSLCGERKTLERIAHTLKTGKPLRN